MSYDTHCVTTGTIDLLFIINAGTYIYKTNRTTIIESRCKIIAHLHIIVLLTTIIPSSLM